MKPSYQERPRKGGGTEIHIRCVHCADTGRARLGTTGDGMEITEACHCERSGLCWRRLLPVRFTAENAQKVHDGVKTQTRRLLTPQPKDIAPWAGRDGGFTFDGVRYSPRYRVGDALWIQEPWRTHKFQDTKKPTLLPENAAVKYEGKPTHDLIGSDAGKLRPAMFLQLRFARPHRYEVVAVRCERVNRITAKDAEAEGCGGGDGSCDRFGDLWNSIYDAPGARFEDAPWVFAYTFRRVV